MAEVIVVPAGAAACMAATVHCPADEEGLAAVKGLEEVMPKAAKAAVATHELAKVIFDKVARA